MPAFPPCASRTRRRSGCPPATATRPSLDEQLKWVLRGRLPLAPGERFAYTNAAYRTICGLERKQQPAAVFGRQIADDRMALPHREVAVAQGRDEAIGVHRAVLGCIQPAPGAAERDVLVG